MDKLKQRRILMMFIGNLFIGIAVALLRISTLGTDPFSTMNLGVSGFLDISFGVYQLLFNILLLGVVFYFAKHTIGYGTLVNMVGIGFVSDFFVHSYGLFFGDDLMLLGRILMMSTAVLIASIGVALYMTPNLGVAPYDALALVIQKVSKDKISFPIARIMTDVTSVIIGFSFGAVVGVATVVMAFFTGPFVQFFRKRLAEPMLKEKDILKVDPVPAK